MPLDPEISLKIAPTMPQGQTNPLDNMSKAMDISNKVLQQRQLNQVFQAKQLMGEIIAGTPSKADGTPDWDGIQKGFLSNPITAPFAPQAMNEIRQLHLTNTQIAGQELDQNAKGRDALIRASLAGYNNIKELDPAMDVYMKSLPPDVAKRMGPVAQQFKSYLTSNLPDDPAKAQQVVKERIVRMQLASGIGVDQLNAIRGTNEELKQGDRNTLITRPPPGSSDPIQVQGSYGIGLAPSTKEITDPQTGRPSQVYVPGMPAGQPGMAGPIPGTAGASPAELEMNKQGAAYQEKLTGDATAGANILKLVKFAREAQKNFTPGGGAEFKSKLASLGQAFGIPQDKLDALANGSLAGKQQFENNLNGIVFSLARQYIPQGSRFAVSEYEGLRDTKPGVNWDPRAVDNVFSEWTHLANQTFDEQREFNKFRKGGGNYADWGEKWVGMQKDRGYIDTNPALRVGNPQDYKTKEELQEAYKNNKITKDAARKIWTQKGWDKD